MFDVPKMQINVNMTGKEYIQYRQSRKFKLSKNVKKALPYFIASSIGIVAFAIMFNNLMFPPTTHIGFFQGYYQTVPMIVTTGWNGIAKFLSLIFAPFLIIGILISWVIHGVGFVVIKR